MTLILTFLMGCGSSAELTPASAAALADQISDNPAAADTVVVDAGLDAATFEAYLYEIAADPALTRQYLDARKP
jgi:hypothetical protein